MKKVLSDIICNEIVKTSVNQTWERVETVGHYNQYFIYDDIILEKLELFFGKKFIDTPIMKVCKFEEGDYISTSTFDYSKASADEYKKYAKTNFVIQVHLNDNFEGGNISSAANIFDVKTGYGLIQNRSAKCSISKIKNGTAYYLFAFISGFKSDNLI